MNFIFLKFYNPNNHCLRTNNTNTDKTKNMSASSKSIAKTAAQKGTVLSKSVAEEKRYKESSAAQKSLQKPVPLGLPSINPQKRAAERQVNRRMQRSDAVDTLQIPINPGMDEANKTAAGVFNTQGTDAFIKHVFTDQDTGRTMSYSESRYRYG